MTEYVFRPLRNGKRARLYSGRYALNRGDKPRTVALGTPDLQVARKRLRDIIVEKQREAEGLIAPRTERETAAQPLTVLLAEFVADLTARKRTARHIRTTRLCIERILNRTESFTRHGVDLQQLEIAASRFVAVIHTLNARG